MASIFSRIVAGEIPSYKIAEDERYYAFLDISPLQKGHTLVIPKREVDYIFDLEDDELAGLQVFAKKVAKAIKKAIPCVKVGQCVLGLEVPHAHIHLVPMQSEADMRFTNPHLKLTPEEFEQIAESIRAAYEETGYLCDPHGAVGYRALCEGLKEGEVGVFLETAHPAKFLATVEKIIGKEVEIPAKLAAFMEGTKQSVSMSKDFADFKAFLMKQ
ncbi:MAG: HIT domain-containing protein [Bacteroidaceae bacterium]|nr:HIT domain-containing protein [Bacteroidaceae bacterium]